LLSFGPCTFIKYALPGHRTPTSWLWSHDLTRPGGKWNCLGQSNRAVSSPRQFKSDKKIAVVPEVNVELGSMRESETTTKQNKLKKIINEEIKDSKS